MPATPFKSTQTFFTAKKSEFESLIFGASTNINSEAGQKPEPAGLRTDTKHVAGLSGTEPA